mgnify:CR=1 FL=1
MKLDVQIKLSGLWAIFTVVACALTASLSLRLVVSVLMVAAAHAALSLLVRRNLLQVAGGVWPGLDAVAAVISWALLSLLVLAVAMVSIWIPMVAVAGLALPVARQWLRREAPAFPSERFVSAERGALYAAIGGALLALYCAAPALKAMAIGRSAFDAAVWIDAPFHASYVAAIARALADGIYVDIHGRGLPVQFYHHGSYAVAAWLSHLSGASALALTQVYTAWGGLWLALALYALASCFVARSGTALCAALLALLVPDSGLFANGHALFGFHWLLQVANASSVALAVVMVALALLVQGCRARRWQIVAVGWAVALLGGLFKAQVFVVAAIPLFFYPALAWRGWYAPTRMGVLAIQIAAVGAVTRLASNWPSLPLIRFDFSAGQLWLGSVAEQAPTWFQMALLEVSRGPDVYAALFVGVVLSIALHAIWAALIGAAALTTGGRVRIVGHALFAFSGAFILLSMGLSADNRMATGGPLEFHFQGQVWGYLCFALGAALLCTECVLRRWGRCGPPLAVLAAFVWFACVVPPAVPLQRATHIPVPSLSAAPAPAEIRALRAALTSCDTMLVADGDPLFIWQAAVETPSWVTDYALNPNHRPEVRGRLAQMGEPNHDYEVWMRAQGITWLVVPDQPARGSSLTNYVPPRPPEFLGTTSRAWRVGVTPKACR